MVQDFSKLFDDISANDLKKKIKKAKIVYSIAMFYDLPDPIQFAKNIKKLISDNGIWVSEQSYCPFMLKNNSFDTLPRKKGYGIVFLKDKEKNLKKFKNIDWSDVAFLSTNSAYNIRSSQITDKFIER